MAPGRLGPKGVVAVLGVWLQDLARFKREKDWGVGTALPDFSLWILKIDIRKAFDTIKQTSVAAMVASKLQHTHRGKPEHG